MRDRFVGPMLGLGYAGLCTTLFRLLFPEEKKFERAIITENSGLFSCFTLYELAIPNSILIDNQTSKTILIKQPYWLDSVDDSRLNTLWGQEINEYPDLIKQKILSVCPNVKKQGRLTFNDQKALRMGITHQLKQNPSVELIEGTCTDMNLYCTSTERIDTSKIDHLFPFYPYRHTRHELESPSDRIISKEMTMDREENVYLQMIVDQKKHTFECTNDMLVYNFSTRPRANPPMKKQSLDESKDLPTITDLFQSPRGKEPKNILVFGSGLSAVWAFEQATQSNIGVVLRTRKSEWPPATIERNKSASLTQAILVYGDEVDFFRAPMFSKKTTEITTGLYNRRQKRVEDYLMAEKIESIDHINDFVFVFQQDSDKLIHAGMAYNALGFIANTDMVMNLPPTIVRNIHFNPTLPFVAPKNLPGGALLDRHNQQVRVLMEKYKDRIPKSLYVDISAMFLREEDKAILVESLVVELEFLDYLFKTIVKLEDSPEDPKKFLNDTFKKWSLTHPDHLSVEEFQKNVDHFFEERERFHSPKL